MATAAARPQRAATGRRRTQWAGFWFVLPVVLGTLMFNLLPMLASLALSFSEWDLITPPRWAGLDNYRRLLFEDPFATNALRNTLLFVLGSVALGMVGSLALALLVSPPLRGIGFFRMAYFIPAVCSSVAVALVWQWVLNGKIGLVNSLLRVVGVEGPNWTSDPRTALLSIIIISVWAGLGYNMMIYLAGLQNIPSELYDAARIDGAGALAQFRHVTLPMLSPTTFFILITTFIGSFQVFDIVFLLTQTGGSGGRGRATDVWIYYLWQTGFSRFQMGYASTMAWALFLIIAGLTLVQWRFANRKVFYE
jgi:multiple sugar transport system permease protein